MPSWSVSVQIASYFRSLGGTITVGRPVRPLGDLPKMRVVLFDLTPKQLVSIVGDRFLNGLANWTYLPGGGIHGMCGYHAARVALRKGFGMAVPVALTDG